MSNTWVKLKTRYKLDPVGTTVRYDVMKLGKGRHQMKKKNVFFRALPELPNPPHDPN